MERLDIFLKPDATFAPPKDKMTRAQMRTLIDRQGDWVFDDTDYFCQVDHGECTGGDDAVFETPAAE